MKKIRNAFCVLLSAVLAASALTACTGGGGGGGSSDPDTVTLMTNDTVFEGFKEYQKKAEKAAGIKLDVITSPSNPSDRLAKITTILSSGDNSVDIISVDDEMMAQYKSAGYLEPLQDTVMTPDVLENFPVDYMKERAMNGDEVYGAPAFMDVLAFWVDEEKVKAAGLEKAPTNKEEFMQFVKANSGGQKYGYGGAWEKTYVFNEIGTFVNLFGGDYSDWTNPKSKEAVQFMYDLMKEGYTPKSQLADQYDPMMQKLIDGTYASHFMYAGGIQTFTDSGKYGPDKIHIAPMPTFEENAAYISCWHYVLNKASVKKEKATEFLKFAVSTDGSKAYHEMCSRMPARLDVLRDPDFDAVGIEEIRGYLDNTTLLARTMAPQSMEFISAIGSLFQQYINDEITLDDYCEKAQAEVEEYLK